MTNKPVVIPGEASETDSEDDTGSKNKGAQAVQGAAIVGEDSESENENDVSIASARSALEHTAIQDTTPEGPRYDTLFHQKLKEYNLQLHNDIQGFCQNTITDANRQLNSIDQHLLKSQLTLQNAVTSLKSINFDSLKTMDENHIKRIRNKRFKPFKQFRYLPGSVTTQKNKADLTQYNQHRFKCFYASPKVDCYPAKLNPYNMYNTKKLREQLAKTQQIDKENKELLKKINLINRHGGMVDTFNKYAYRKLEFWRGHEHMMHKIVQHNKQIYERLVTAVSRYPTAAMLAEWNKMLQNIMHSCQFPFVILAKEDKDKTLAAQPSISQGLPPSPQPMARPRCFMDFKVDKGEYLGRIIIELYFEFVPVTVQNFLEICKGASNLTYKNCLVHSIIRGKYLETGDITLGTGRGGISVYGDSFQEENHVLKHAKAVIEHLPQELRDRFTDMREMDLTIHNNMDELEKRVKIFFNDCKRYPPDQLPQNVDAEFQAIRKEYYKNLEEADEKVQLASQMYDLVDKYLRRLDSELHKFKCELEADNKGITEVLEKRSLELDTPNNTSSLSSLQQKENRYESFRYNRPRSEKRRDSVVASLSSSSGGVVGSAVGPAASATVPYVEKRQAVAAAVVPPPLVETRHTVQSAATAATAAASSMPVTSTSAIGYNTGYSLGAGPAIAAAASQAIAATQQMQQGRRTASLKASYEAINTGGHGHEFNIGKELAGAAQTAIQAIQQDHANNKKKQKKWSSNTSSSSSATSAVSAPIIPAAQVVVPAPESPSVDMAAQNAEVTDGEWTYDPNEPRYCLCNQVSYGDMVACDNEDCPSEWFHYPCVGITAPPKGKWYCPQCTATMKRRRKN